MTSSSSSASRSFARLPSPPISPAKRPPGLSARKIARAACSFSQHPVQRRVGESRVELGDELHVRGVQQQRVDALGPRRRDHLGRIVDAEHGRAALDDLPRQRPLAAADVEDPLARLRVEQVERRAAELGDERADPRIIRGIPFAGRDDGLAQSVFTHSR